MTLISARASCDHRRIREVMVKPREACAHCGGRFGLVTYRWWCSRFCKKACKDAHLREIALGR